jgi:hypothetical protein
MNYFDFHNMINLSRKDNTIKNNNYAKQYLKILRAKYL